MTKLTYKRYGFKNGGSPLEIITDSFDFPTDAQGNFIIPKNKILIKIYYASLNPVDYKLKKITYFPPFSLHGIGKDYSGEIVGLGSNVKNFKVGEFVQGFHPGVITDDGTFSQYLLIDTKGLFKTEIATVPQNISLEQAAAWPLVLGTAIKVIGDLPIKGKKILVFGGATSVGRYLVQLLQAEQAGEIVVSCSSRSQELVTELGATKIINYRENVLNRVLENVKDKPFDYIFDAWGGNELFPHLKQILVKNGTYHTIVGDDPHSFFTGTSKSFFRTFLSWLHLLDYSYQYVLLGAGGTGWINKAREYVANDDVQIFIDKIYKFEDLNDAIEYNKAGTAQGKLIINVKDFK